MDYQKGVPRSQIQMTSWESEVAQDSFVRVIDLLVDAMPLEKWGFSHMELGKEGNQPYHPKDLLKLLLYGYRYKLRSSKSLSNASRVNIEVRWLINDLKPSARTINYFRTNNIHPIEKAHRFFVQMMKEWSLVGGKAVAVDGMKIRGQNSIKNNFNQKKIDRNLKYIDGKISDYLNEISEIKKKQRPSIDDKGHLDAAKKKIEILDGRRIKHEVLSEQIAQSSDGQISTIDTEAKAIHVNRHNVEVGYNLQATVDMDHQIIIDVCTGGLNDQYELRPMAARAQEITGEKEIHIAADAGYHNGIEIALVEESGVHTYVAPGKEGVQTHEGFAKADFKYDPSDDSYQCPQGHKLKTNGQLHWKVNSRTKHKVKRYSAQICNKCVVKDVCTQNVKGRVIERAIHQDLVDQNNQRVKRYRSFYQLRQQTIEPVFGTLKRHWDMSYTLLKGREKIETEFRLAAIMYNLTRSVSILGIEEVKNRLKKAISFILNIYEALKIVMMIKIQSRA